jgi:hypothetical protein
MKDDKKGSPVLDLLVRSGVRWPVDFRPVAPGRQESEEVSVEQQEECELSSEEQAEEDAVHEAFQNLLSAFLDADVSPVPIVRQALMLSFDTAAHGVGLAAAREYLGKLLEAVHESREARVASDTLCN